MGKDEELLLVNMEQGDSDSDEVVEEFKLPPKRSRRKRKHVPDTRVHDGSGGLITWRCCFSFIILSIIISGGLVLAFFIYNMHTQIYTLKEQLESYRGNSNTIFKNHEQTINKLSATHSDIESFRSNHELMVKKLNALNATVEALSKRRNTQGGGVEVERQITNLKTDVQDLQSSSAKASASLSTTQQMLLKTVQKLNKDVGTLKLEALNPSGGNPLNGGSSEESTGDYMSRSQVNALIKKFSDHIIDEQTTASNELTDLKTLYRTMNLTHNQDLVRLTKNVISIKKSVDTFQDEFSTKYQPLMMDVKNATRDVYKQMMSHNESIKTMNGMIRTLREEFSRLNTTHKIPGFSTSSFVPLTGEKTKETLTTQTTLKKVATTMTTTQQPISSNTTSTNAVTPNATNTNNGAVMPDAPKINQTNASPTMPSQEGGDDVTKTTPSHVFNGIPTAVKEQPARNESAKDYKNFQSNPTASTAETPQNFPAGNPPQGTSGMTTGEAENANQENLNTKKEEQEKEMTNDNTADAGSPPLDRAGAGGSPYDRTGGMDGSSSPYYNGESASPYDGRGVGNNEYNPNRLSHNSEDQEDGGGNNLLNNLLHNSRLSPVQKRRLLQNLLRKQAPDYGGD